MPRNDTDRQDESQEQDDSLDQDGDLEGMAVEVNSNQIHNEAIPASHDDEKSSSRWCRTRSIRTGRPPASSDP